MSDAAIIHRRALFGGIVGLVAWPGVAARAATIRVDLRTTLGDIVIAVDTARAPISGADFLRYVDRGLFAGAEFYRTVRPDNDPDPHRIDVIQGGVTEEAKFLPGVAHEPTSQTGLRHRDGTVSLARRGVGTGTGGAIFICVGDQPSLDFGGARNPDGQGFAAFGRVVAGMDVVRRIWTSKATGEGGVGVGQQLTPPIPILDARRIGRRP